MKTDSSNVTMGPGGSPERALVDAAWRQVEKLPSRIISTGVDSTASFAIPGYRVLGEVHRGGQGVVYQAIQVSTRRKVAIKVLKHGPFADATEFARFDREIDVLSRLNHPNIVAIRDRGLTAGHAYYVMDFIPGRPLDAHVAGSDMPVRDVLRLFVDICEAVNVAHLRGVIHRDLKPGNIRVTEDGEPRILDFGLAKLDQEGASSSAQNMTVTGQFIGSLPWASPEQAEGKSETLDIRTDVYSLGVILYHLLSGRFPYPVTGQLSDVIRHITQTSPTRPSTAERRVDHDLELIILKCLAKEPERRYQSAGELARDIRRYLADETVSATSPSVGYRLRKFVRRNRLAVAAGVTVAAALVVGAGVSVGYGMREAHQRQLAEVAKTRAEKAEGEAEQLLRFQGRQLAKIDARGMGENLHTGLLKKARAAAERAKQPPDVIDGQIAELETLITGSDFTGLALESLEHSYFKPALNAIREQYADQPRIMARLLQGQATTLCEVGLLEAAIVPQEEALSLRQHVLGEEHTETLNSIENMGFLLRSRGKFAEAELYLRDVLEKRRRVLGEDDPLTLTSINDMGSILTVQGKLAEAAPFCRESLEKSRRILGDHPRTYNAMSAMATLLSTEGKLEEAEVLFREALEGRRRVLGDYNIYTPASLNSMSHILQAQAKLDEAEHYSREALEICRRFYGESHSETILAINNLGQLLKAKGKLGESEPLCREAMEKYRKVLGIDHTYTLAAINNMAGLLLARGKFDEGAAYCREALDRRRRLLGEDSPATLTSVTTMGEILTAQGNSAEAFALLAPAEAAARKAFTAGNSVRLGRYLGALGAARAAGGEFETAEANLLEAHRIVSQAQGAFENDRTTALRRLIALYDAWHAAQPGGGHEVKAADWRNKL